MSTRVTANLYPQGGPNPTVVEADSSRANVGVCFSGGGSRALTCAWGQMIGLRRLNGGEGKSVMDRVRYISSVSGGTWASALYTYLPASIAEDEFFTPLYAPPDLYLGSAPAGGLDVSEMGANALGRVPQKFKNLFELNPFDNIIVDFLAIILAKRLDFSESLKWLWMYIVGNNVLAPFGLYTYRSSFFSFWRKEVPWRYPGAKSISLTPDYAAQNIFDKSEHPDKSSFQFVRGDQASPAVPMLIMNTNIVATDCPGVRMSGPLQVPIQVTPVSGGSFGSNPCVAGDAVGGGSVESFAFSSQLQALTDEREVSVELPRLYSLVDIVASSSAFYAATLADQVTDAMDMMLQTEERGFKRLLNRHAKLGRSMAMPEKRERLRDMRERAAKLGSSDLVPVYNYWPAAAASSGPAANADTQFTDGGNLENTGVVGMLAQTEVETIISFINTSVELRREGGVIVAAAQASPLFGVAFDSKSNQFQDYQANGVNPFTGETDPKGFLKVFDNSGGEFEALRKGLFGANDNAERPAFFQQSLNVVDNPLAGVKARTGPVTVLWVQNARVNDWQTKIADRALREAIDKGQSRRGGLSDFADFPYYSTFTKIHQTAAETNALAQMWAWCVGSEDSPLSSAIEKLF